MSADTPAAASSGVVFGLVCEHCQYTRLYPLTAEAAAAAEAATTKEALAKVLDAAVPPGERLVQEAAFREHQRHGARFRLLERQGDA